MNSSLYCILFGNAIIHEKASERYNMNVEMNKNNSAIHIVASRLS
jgi:hypothetical protein